jgi:hypothetical protein
LQQSSSKAIPSTAALLATGARIAAASVALSAQRDVTCSAAFIVTTLKTIICTACLSSEILSDPNATMYTRSGNCSMYVRSGDTICYTRNGDISLYTR